MRKKREDSEFECVAENGVGDPVSAKAKLEVIDGKFFRIGRSYKSFFPILASEGKVL